MMLGVSAGDAQVEQLRRQMGLDQSIPVQFGYWLAKVAVGDFGHLITNGLALPPLILERFQVSALIMLVAVTIAAWVAGPAGPKPGGRQKMHNQPATPPGRHLVP